jgi:hypothetical protein
MKANPLERPVAGSIFSVRLSMSPNLEKYSLKSSLKYERIFVCLFGLDWLHNNHKLECLTVFGGVGWRRAHTRQCVVVVVVEVELEEHFKIQKPPFRFNN